jgi:hypothetical protein
MGEKSRTRLLVILSLAILSQHLFVAVNCQEDTTEEIETGTESGLETDSGVETETETESGDETDSGGETGGGVTTQAPETETTTELTVTEAPRIPTVLDYRFSSLIGGFTVCADNLVYY